MINLSPGTVQVAKLLNYGFKGSSDEQTGSDDSGGQNASQPSIPDCDAPGQKDLNGESEDARHTLLSAAVFAAIAEAILPI